MIYYKANNSLKSCTEWMHSLITLEIIIYFHTGVTPIDIRNFEFLFVNN